MPANPLSSSPLRRAACVFSGLLALLAPAIDPSLAASAQTVGPAHPLISTVVLRGVQHVDPTALRLGLATKSSKCRGLLYAPFCLFSHAPSFYEREYLDPEEFQRDVIRIRIYYWQHGYRDAMVTARTEPGRGGVRAIFDVTENQPTIVDRVTVEQVDSVLTQRTIDNAMHIRAGQPLDLIAVDSTRLMLRDALWEAGYANAEVALDTTAISRALHRGPVRLVVTPGPITTVQAIDLQGNRQVSDRTVRRLLDVHPGDLYRRSAVLGSQRNLYLSGLFSAVDFTTRAAGDSQRVLTLQLTESDLHRLQLGTGITTADFVQLDAQFTRYNVFGSARRLTLRSTLSNLFAGQLNGAGVFYDVTSGAEGSARNRFLRPAWAVSLEFNQPWLGSPHNQLGTSVFAHRRSVPGVVIDLGTGATIAFTREIGARINSTLGYTYESTRVEASDAYFCVSFGVCQPDVIRVIGARSRLSPVAWVTQVDQTDDPFAATHGYRLRVDLQHASRATMSDFHFNRAALAASAYRALSPHSVLAGQVRFGWVHALGGTGSALGLSPQDGTPIIHPRERFFAGGSRSVRGYGENQLGPRVLTIAPQSLTDTALASPCTEAQLEDLSCDPNTVGVSARSFQPQPVGGTTLAEASIEYRFPLSLARGLTGAVFVDGAVVGASQLSPLVRATGAVTPGFGIRFDTRVGPVRLDLGVRPSLVESLPVVTQVPDSAGGTRLVTLRTLRRYNPVQRSGGALRGLLNRLQLHLAIGPPY